MKVIRAENVNHALPQGLGYLRNEGVKEQSRNGAVLVGPEPVCTVYHNPTQRVLFSAIRDANPFFHLMESLWMLAGRDDVEFVNYYAGSMKQFSDDGETLHGAYGYRWRHALGYDQISHIIAELKQNPTTRRCVLQMWDAGGGGMDDMYKAMNGGKDVPCNTHVYFDTIGGPLNMTVCCRSNDVVWGAYGANVVHFSMLQEYVARSANLKIGVYRQISNNYHVYAERPDVVKLMAQRRLPVDNRYSEHNYRDTDPKHAQALTAYPIMTNGEQGRWDADMYRFFDTWRPSQIMQRGNFHDPFWRDVVTPMVNAHVFYNLGDKDHAPLAVEACAAEDWRAAGREWLQRRKEAANV